MYNPPEIIAASVFAELPDRLKMPVESHGWVMGQPLGALSGSLIEGPSIGPDGALYCVELQHGRILRINSDREFEVVVEYDGWPNGLTFHRDGRFFIADHKHGVMVFDPAGKRIVEPVLNGIGPERFKGINDLFFASNGDLYFTDQGLTGWHDPSGRLFRLRADGRLDCLLDNVPSPNGLVMNLDETAIYLAVTRANAVWRVPLMRDGTVSKVGTFIQLSGGIGPDGLALDSEGRLAIAHVGMGIVWLVDRRGEPVARIQSCRGSHTTNVAFGGPDDTTLYVTESSSGCMLSVDLKVPGAKMFSNPAQPGHP